MGATTIWVWEKPNNKATALEGSLYLRPGNVYGVSKAMLDAQQWGNELAILNQQQAEVALLYSPTSLLWDEAYRLTSRHAYTALNLLGQKVTFISEKQLAENRRSHANAKVKYLIVPDARHVHATTLQRLDTFVSQGGKLILMGDKALAFNPYEQRQTLPQYLRGLDRVAVDSSARKIAQT